MCICGRMFSPKITFRESKKIRRVHFLLSLSKLNFQMVFWMEKRPTGMSNNVKGLDGFAGALASHTSDLRANQLQKATTVI